MTTATLTKTEASTGTRHHIHWVCLTQLDTPLISLCGDLPPGQRRRVGRVSCPDCLERIHPHAATCALCAPHAKRY